MAPTLVALRTALPPEGALRLRPGVAGSAALAGGGGYAAKFVALRAAFLPEGALAGEGDYAAKLFATPAALLHI